MKSGPHIPALNEGESICQYNYETW